MKKLLFVVLTVVMGAAASQARAQTAPDYPGPGPQTKEASPRKARKASGEDIARMQRRMSMNPNEAKRDQQQEILDARAGGGTANTSFGRAAGPARQYEKGNGGFMVRKFKDKRGTAQQKRGQSRRAPGVDPKGKPLTHKKPHHFLFF